ncbi:MAG: molybdopterin-dependent oxidoreductase, partial [Acidimicrobiia bacterium]|nr:molybdopterin-dependent oxidoreductase [Acidimicrobiia bacterium]
MTTETEGSILGNAVVRREDPALLQGVDAYFDDIAVDRVAYVHFVRSTVAHARLVEVDINAAETMPGVIGVYAAENTTLPPLSGMGPPELARPMFAQDKVRLVGEVVACVVAETRAQAEDAAEMVFVEYDELDVILDGETALAAGAELLFPDHGSNECFHTKLGDDEDPLAGSAHMIELVLDSQRLAAVPIEANGALAIPDGTHLMVWIPSQNPISVASTLATSLGMEVGKDLRVGAPPAVGGGFGAKAGLAPEIVVTAWLAREHGRAVKWTETRSENMVAMTQGRDMKLTARLGLDDDGRFTGLDATVIADVGAYAEVGAILPTFTEMMIQGVYDIPKVRFEARSALTNKTPIAAYRGAGRPEATQLLERLVDVAAAEVGLDPVELRRRNFIAPDRFPLTVHSGQVYDNGEYAM